MHTFKAIIIDDEANNRENLKYLLKQHCPKIDLLGEASSASEGINLIKNTKPDVIFLDIIMPEQSGFDLLKALYPFNFKVIFVTAHDSYALNAIKFSALDYILKPLDKEELVNAVKRLEATVKEQPKGQVEILNQFFSNDNKQKKIALKLIDEVRLVPLEQIIRCEADNNYTLFTLKNGEKIMVSKNIGYYDKLLHPVNFMRTHQSHLINKEHISKFVKRDGGYLEMVNGDIIPISRSNKTKVNTFFFS